MMSAIQNSAAGTAAASFVASQIGSSIAGTFGMGYAKLVFGQAAWLASIGVLGEKMANGTATGGDYANVIQKTGDLLLGLGLTIVQVNPWVRGAFAIASGGRLTLAVRCQIWRCVCSQKIDSRKTVFGNS